METPWFNSHAKKPVCGYEGSGEYACFVSDCFTASEALRSRQLVVVVFLLVGVKTCEIGPHSSHEIIPHNSGTDSKSALHDEHDIAPVRGECIGSSRLSLSSSPKSHRCFAIDH